MAGFAGTSRLEISPASHPNGSVRKRKQRLREVSQTLSHSSCVRKQDSTSRLNCSLAEQRIGLGEAVFVELILERVTADGHQLFGLKNHHHLSVRERNIRFH